MGVRDHVWPAFREEWILYEDADLIVVDKPSGVSSEAADPSAPDDVPTRLRRYLAARDRVAEDEVYLGTHQRLDGGTSGVLFYTRSKRANASIAAQQEAGAIQKEYLALVPRWPHGDRVLEHLLTPRREGRVEVAGPRDKSAKPAKTSVRVLARSPGATLLGCRLHTGRTHQIRVQLGASGAAIDGDALYGGRVAPRLMLHATKLSLTHPVTGERLAIEAPEPAIFTAFRESKAFDPYADNAVLRQLVARAVDARWGLAHTEGLDAFRLIHDEGDGLVGLSVDRYGDYLVASLMDERAAEHEDRILDALADLGFRGVYVKRRPKQASTLVDTRRDEVAPSDAVRGENAPETFDIIENGLRYDVRLGDGLSTGIFLDQRENRARVRDLASGARVLNLFAYTGAFTVSALAGGALETLTIDASKESSKRAEARLRRTLALAEEAPLPLEHSVRVGDAFDALVRLAKQGRSFDLVVVDPPTYATTKTSRWTSGKQWVDLFRSVLRVASPNAVILATSNDRRMNQASFRRFAKQALEAEGRVASRVRDVSPPRDFTAFSGEAAHMKGLWLHLGPS